MSSKGYKDELGRALARPDAAEMCRVIDAYIDDFARGMEWPDDLFSEFDELMWSFQRDPDKALAYVILAASRSDDASFLGFMGCGLLEDLLYDPSPELLLRISAEARKSDRFRWMLSNPFKVAIAPRAWDAIEKFRITGPHEEPAEDTLPPRP
ncbi:MAG: DUF6869 domain-containing protein [Parasphingorhabdus sp.]